MVPVKSPGSFPVVVTWSHHGNTATCESYTGIRAPVYTGQP
jgi:hypothetical protein